MKCPECGYNSFDYLESCKKCGTPLYPDPLFEYAYRKPERSPEDVPEVRNRGGMDETAGRETQRIPVRGTDSEPSGGGPGEPIQSQHKRSLNINGEIGRESFGSTSVSKEKKKTAEEELRGEGAGGEIPLFADDEEFPGPEDLPLVVDEIDEGVYRHDSREELEFDKGKPELFNLAGVGARGAALIIDIVIVSVTALLSIATGLYLLNGPHAGNPDLGRVVVPLYLALFFLASTYFIFLHGFCGKTVGKMVFGIRLINSEGGAVGLWDAFVRWIGYFVSAGFLFIGFLWSLFDSEGQTWHDKIAGTYVVKD